MFLHTGWYTPLYVGKFLQTFNLKGKNIVTGGKAYASFMGRSKLAFLCEPNAAQFSYHGGLSLSLSSQTVVSILSCALFIIDLLTVHTFINN